MLRRSLIKKRALCAAVTALLLNLLLSSCSSERAPYFYIRKAYKDIEKNRYASAIRLFRKAEAAAPQSADVRSHLINGYVLWASNLDRNGETGKALDVLTESGVVPTEDEEFASYLAYLYAKSAFGAYSEGDPLWTERYLDKAIRTGMLRSKSRGLLSDYLNNEAMKLFSLDAYPMAVKSLKLSYALWQREVTLKLLAQVTYQAGRLEEPLEYWKRLNEEYPDEEYSLSYAKVKKEIALSGDMVSQRIADFNVVIEGDMSGEIDRGRLEKVLSRIYDDVGRDLGVFPPPGTEIVCYSSGTFRNIFDREGMLRGFYDGKIRIPLFGGEYSEDLDAVLAHEYTHAVVSMLTAKQVPSWITEGIAVFEQSRYENINVLVLRGYVDKYGFPSIDDIDRGFSDRADRSRLTSSYIFSYTIIRFIIDRWGVSGLRDLLHRLSGGEHYANAIDNEFLISIETFHSLWVNYLKERL